MTNDLALAILQEAKRQADEIKQLYEKIDKMEREMLDVLKMIEEQRQLEEEVERKLKDLKDEFLKANPKYDQRERAREQAVKRGI